MMGRNNLFDKRIGMLDVLPLNGFLSGISEKLCILFAVIFLPLRAQRKYAKSTKASTWRFTSTSK
jgi:hypothetical protein